MLLQHGITLQNSLERMIWGKYHIAKTPADFFSNSIGWSLMHDDTSAFTKEVTEDVVEEHDGRETHVRLSCSGRARRDGAPLAERGECLRSMNTRKHPTRVQNC